MDRTPLDPPIADLAPADDALTHYDRDHFVTYVRLLDAEADGAHWEDVARAVLHIDPTQEYARARRAYESHLARAKRMTREGFKFLLKDDPYGSAALAT